MSTENSSPRLSPDHIMGTPSINTRDEHEKAVGPSPPADPSTILTGKRLAIVFVAMRVSLALLDRPRPNNPGHRPPSNRLREDTIPFILSTTPPVLPHPGIRRVLPPRLGLLVLHPHTDRLPPLLWPNPAHIPAKWVLISAIALFEIGSLVCGVAQDMKTIIVGRVVSGVGAAGIFVSMFQIIAQATRLEDRPRLFGLFGALFGLASVIG
ncbi:hypothetical protein C8R46DRAFT_1233990 [Mycena filopes]|nr:hypothetical protein C8R46DRAFT_1233990 [Mycena filopes]